MPRAKHRFRDDAGRRALRSLLARLRDERQAPAAAKALEDAESRLFLQEYEAFYADLQENRPEEWTEAEREAQSFDGTLMDGLADE